MRMVKPVAPPPAAPSPSFSAPMPAPGAPLSGLFAGAGAGAWGGAARLVGGALVGAGEAFRRPPPPPRRNHDRDNDLPHRPSPPSTPAHRGLNNTGQSWVPIV